MGVLTQPSLGTKKMLALSFVVLALTAAVSGQEDMCGKCYALTDIFARADEKRDAKRAALQYINEMECADDKCNKAGIAEIVKASIDEVQEKPIMQALCKKAYSCTGEPTPDRGTMTCETCKTIGRALAAAGKDSKSARAQSIGVIQKNRCDNPFISEAEKTACMKKVEDFIWAQADAFDAKYNTAICVAQALKSAAPKSTTRGRVLRPGF